MKGQEIVLMEEILINLKHTQKSSQKVARLVALYFS